MSLHSILLAIPLASLAGAILAGFFGRRLGEVGSHTVTILGVAISFLLSAYVFKLFAIDGHEIYNASVYTWMISDGIRFEVGFLVDNLTAMMMVVVTFVS